MVLSGEKMRASNISLCMIVKNEGGILANCLSSVKDLVDEIIIVDTGSTDDTVEVAKRFTDKIYFYKWNDNFSDARNFSLSFATKDWVLSLDADEVINEKDNERIRNLIKEGKADGYLFNWRDYTNDTNRESWIKSEGDEYSESKVASGFYIDKVLRFFRNKKGYLFEGRIHETPHHSIEKLDGVISDSDVVMHHFGNIDKGSFLSKKKKYSDLLKERLDRKDFVEKPEDYICYELAKELTAMKKYDEALVYIKRAIEVDEKQVYLVALSTLYALLGNNLEAEKELKKMVVLDPRNAGLHCNLGIIYARNSQYNKAVRKFEKAIELDPDMASVYFNLALLYKEKGKKERMNYYFEKAIEINPKYRNRLV